MARLSDFAGHGWGPAEPEDQYDSKDPTTYRERLLRIIARSAFDNLRAYSNCCRSTLWAIQTHLRCENPATLRAASTLAGGIGGTGETCGALLGALMAIGQAIGPMDFAPGDEDRRARSAAATMTQAFAEAFEGTRCYTVQKSLIGWCCDDPEKAKAYVEADGKIACASACAFAARTAARIILESGALPD